MNPVEKLFRFFIHTCCYHFKSNSNIRVIAASEILEKKVVSGLGSLTLISFCFISLSSYFLDETLLYNLYVSNWSLTYCFLRMNHITISPAVHTVAMPITVAGSGVEFPASICAVIILVLTLIL